MDETKSERAPSDARVRGFALGVGAIAVSAFGVFALRARHSTDRTPAVTPVEVASGPRAPAPPASAASAITAGANPEDEPESLRVALGRKLFFEKGLSEPAGTSCASCHDPALGYAGSNGGKFGVARGSRPGHFARRNTPSLLYLKFVRPFHFHWEEDAPLPDAHGGFFWDGRSDKVASLVRQPLLNPDEMGNPDPGSITKKVLATPYVEDLRKEFGETLDTPEGTLSAVGDALEAFLLRDAMAPFSSKYDDYVRGRAALSPNEARGLELFKDPERGNCASCHRLNDKLPNPERSLFTDYGFEAVAVPRNAAIPKNRAASYFDLGLCERHEPGAHTDEDRLCGSFRTPSLRNVALRPSFMHNGAFSKLKDVVTFYATRGTDPKHWYAHGRFDDLPPKFHPYVNVDRPPYDRGVGDASRLDAPDIDAIVAFLGTLTDTTYP